MTRPAGNPPPDRLSDDYGAVVQADGFRQDATSTVFPDTVTDIFEPAAAGGVQSQTPPDVLIEAHQHLEDLTISRSSVDERPSQGQITFRTMAAAT